jgi:hypothetical protein
MAKGNKGGGWLFLILAGAAALVAQDIVKDETESWLKRNGLWPK